MKELIEYVTNECNAIDADERYDAWLDEIYDGCDMCKRYGPSRILREVNPTAYHCGFNDWIDGELSKTMYEIEGQYYDKTEIDNARDQFVDDLESERDDLEGQIEDLADNSEDTDDRTNLQADVERLNKRIDEAKKYDFGY